MPQHRNLSAVREGDPGHVGKKKLAARLAAGREAPTEPDWSAIFVGDDIEIRNCRATAEAEWRSVVAKLDGMGLLAGALDFRAVMDYAVCCARLDQCERHISQRGTTTPGREGTVVRNPDITSATQYRTQLNRLIAHLGLSPHARAGLAQPEGQQGDDDDPFSA